MIIDSEFRDEYRKKLNKLVSQTIEGLSTGNFYDVNGVFQVGRYERERGVITGLGYALNLLENKPVSNPAETQSEDETNETSNAN